MVNVYVLVDIIKLLTLIILHHVKNVELNVKNVQDLMYALTVMLKTTESLDMMNLDIKPVFVLLVIQH